MRMRLRDIDKYWTYQVIREDGELVFIGCGRLNDIYSWSRFRQCKYIRMDEVLEIRLMNGFSHRIDALNAVCNMCAEIKLPLFNSVIRDYSCENFVVCNETKRIYRNAAETARQMQLTPSALCYHLKGKKGYRTVKGYTFREMAVVPDIRSVLEGKECYLPDNWTTTTPAEIGKGQPLSDEWVNRLTR